MGFSKQQDQWNALNVSRETLDKLQAYADLLVKWQAKINLVSNSTLDDLWNRHLLDSAQIYPYLPKDCKTLVDIGCGAGFPGMVLAIMGVPDVHMVDSDARKMAFVREVSRITETPVTIHNCRIDDVKEKHFADVVTSRALATLEKLLGFSSALKKEDARCIFLKGKKADEEIIEAQNSWDFECESKRSLSDPQGQILIIEGMTRK
ncbi:Ribosomal RNA small subunit methyltransferase G [Candidatus Terasakiella magnetica]|uniref:Ribosomal RNA small subunit methyltransferase G n=1 Tax=Candidatus Terasakiella magnetica TaxID=1867952 RepID=A0A1C3RGH1_9PROT|nr:16S rRNA (guanine(527)-N(7))-methyltransferase RsmG [Candidatus Terasakiella magnetica]SCA56359.1 Ribosomal RNA small subunit methyltransferase G [Candidatus Terasakiella magnetica]